MQNDTKKKNFFFPDHVSKTVVTTGEIQQKHRMYFYFGFGEFQMLHK